MKRRLNFFIAGGILLVGLILGSFLDLQINQAIFDRYNGFGLVVSSFGMIPGYGCLALLGGALACIALKEEKFQKWLKAIFVIFSIAMYGVATYFLGKDVFSINGFYNPELHKWLGYLIMGILMVPVYIGGYFLGKLNTYSKMWIVILIVSAAIFMALVPGVTLFKSIMHRPRYRIAIYEGYVNFRNWWEPFKDYKEAISAFGLTKEEFKSFPSGHSGAVMVGLITFSYLPLFIKKLEKYQTLLFWGAFAWGLVVMFSRMLVGAHFLSDVCFGALLTLIFFYIANEIIVRKLLCKEEKQEEQLQEAE